MQARQQTQVIQQADIEQIALWLESNPCLSDEALKPLTREFPEVRFTLCSEDELGIHEPFGSFSYFDLHLVAHNLSGCSSLTPSLEMCSGLVIALHEEQASS